MAAGEDLDTPAPLAQLRERAADRLQRGVGVLLHLDHVPLERANRLRGGKHRREVHRAGAELLGILQVQRADPAALLPDELGGIFPAHLHPVDVGLAAQVPRRRRVEDPVEHAAAVDDRELIRVVVQGELDAVGAKGGADGAELLADARAGGAGVVVLARPVGADDVARPEEQAKIVDATVAAFGGIDILVNNAATNPLFGPVENTSSEIFDKIMALNLRAPFELAKAVRPHFIARGGGAIINLSSIGGVSPEAGLGIYNVSKAALISLTQVLAREWGKDNIRANVICPGLIKTDFSAALWQNEQILKHMMRGQALTRLADPVDIASLALFLAAEASAFCTGATFMADGGYTI